MLQVGSVPLVLGAQGFLGSNVVASLRQKSPVIAHSRRTLISSQNVENVVFNLENFDEFEKLLDSYAVSYVVNCVALADVDLCEKEPAVAQAVNAHIPAHLSVLCHERGIPFVHVSTDAIFDGMSSEYTADSEPSPINVYGRSKLNGERLVLDSNRDALVLRTNIIGWSPSGRRSLFEFFVNNLRAGAPCKGFTDITFRPISAWRFSSIVEVFLREGVTGIHHAVGGDLLSKFEFGQAVARALGCDEALVIPARSDGEMHRVHRSPALNLVPSPRLGSLALPIKHQLLELLDLEEHGLRKELSSFVSQG
jgi:dTDP-4-dehydrorhamnose reductase